MSLIGNLLGRFAGAASALLGDDNGRDGHGGGSAAEDLASHRPPSSNGTGKRKRPAAGETQPLGGSRANSNATGRKRQKTKHGDDGRTANSAAPPSLSGLPADCALTVQAFLRLGERAKLAATCHNLRINEREAEAKHSREERTNSIVERAKLKGQTDEEFDKAFSAALEEFNGAGALGAPGLLGLLPLVAPLCQYLPRYDFSRRNKWEKPFRPAAARWLPFLDAVKLAEEAAGRLIAAGPLPADVRMRQTHNFGIPFNFTGEARAACEMECEEIFKLGLLGRAAVPHLSTLLGRILPPLNGEDQLDKFEENCWSFSLACSKHYGISRSSISSLALETLLVLKPSLLPSDVNAIAKFLDPHLCKKDSQLSVVGSTLVVSKLWGLFESNDTARKALGLIPLSEVDSVACSRERYQVIAQCELICVSKSTRHLSFLLAAAQHRHSYVKDAAEEALWSIVPLLVDPGERRLANEAIWRLAERRMS